jgi:hypothetical protein
LTAGNGAEFVFMPSCVMGIGHSSLLSANESGLA